MIWPDNCQQTMMYNVYSRSSGICVFSEMNASRVMNLLKQLLAFGCWPAAGCV